ncbi:MAG TPA: hypothetical protein VK307_12125 [Thermoleophilaceae bacterium]|nr:hypothetical protein [Thermoleophilaceae bacterium]
MIELARARDITALFRESLAVYVRHAGVFVALSAAVVVPVFLIVQGIGLEQLSADYDSSPSVAEAAVPTVVSFLVVTPIVTAICIHALRSVAAGEQIGAGRAFVSGFEAFTPLFFAVALAAIGIAVGFLALIVPGIYLAVRWFFVPQAVVIDRGRGPAALTRSGDVVHGFWWRTFGLVVLVNLAVALPAVVLTAPFAAIAESTDRAIWSLAGSIVAESVTAPFAALFSTLLYYDLRARR